MKLTNLDSFIDSTTGFLSAYPSATLSVTYSTKNSKQKVEKPKPPVVRVKVYDPKSGKCIKYHTSKAKELLRVLVFLGPMGISTGGVRKVGVASLMSNTKFEEVEEKVKEKEKEKEVVAAPKKGKKKKGKR